MMSHFEYILRIIIVKRCIFSMLKYLTVISKSLCETYFLNKFDIIFNIFEKILININFINIKLNLFFVIYNKEVLILLWTIVLLFN